jgi:hypothetical protein
LTDNRIMSNSEVFKPSLIRNAYEKNIWLTYVDFL